MLEYGVASMQLDYRHPGQLEPCTLDVLTGIRYLESMGRRRVILVGHSFGGAVVIRAGAASPTVIAVAALSSQNAGTEMVEKLSPRPVLFMHGSADEILADTNSRNLFRKAGEPKKLLLYPGCRHGLDHCREEVDRDLLGWLREVAAIASTKPSMRA